MDVSKFLGGNEWMDLFLGGFDESFRVFIQPGEDRTRLNLLEFWVGVG